MVDDRRNRHALSDKAVGVLDALVLGFAKQIAPGIGLPADDVVQVLNEALDRKAATIVFDGHKFVLKMTPPK